LASFAVAVTVTLVLGAKGDGDGSPTTDTRTDVQHMREEGDAAGLRQSERLLQRLLRQVREGGTSAPGDRGAEPLDALPPAEALPYVERRPLADVVCAYEWDCDRALAIFTGCENKERDPHRISATGDYGITQINRFTWRWWLDARGFDFDAEWSDPVKNVAMAYEIWRDGGSVQKRSFHHWSCA
jgi:hypothetical protein